MTEADLVRAVLAEPDSDAARRAFGDWAKARPFPDGDPPRGELVEVQLALAKAHREHVGTAAWLPMYKRSKELLAASGLRWRAPLDDLVAAGIVPAANPEKLAFEFRRGFIEHVDMTARAFAEHAQQVFAKAPIRFVTLGDVAAYPKALASPQLAQIAGLSMIAADVDDDAIELLAGSPHARRLRWLAIPSNRLTRRGLEAICSSPHLRGLLYCECSGNGFDNPVDRFGNEGEAIVSTEKTELGLELEQKYGVQPWLHAPWYFGLAYPPDLEAAADSLPATPAEYATA